MGSLCTHNGLCACLLCELLQDARGVYILDRSCVVSEVKPYTTAYDKKKVSSRRSQWT